MTGVPVSDESARPTSSSAPESTGPKRKGKAKRKHTIGRVVLASSLVLALVTGLSMVFYYRYLNGNLTVEDVTPALGDDRPEKVYTGNGEPLNVLVMGDDTRVGKGNKIDGESGGGGSDTTILLHISGDRERAYGISIPRDSIVDRPDCGADEEIPGGTEVMWNAAYAVGGAACTIKQVEANTGIFIDHYVVVDFNGFKDMVDAVDGVDVADDLVEDDPLRDREVDLEVVDVHEDLPGGVPARARRRGGARWIRAGIGGHRTSFVG